MVVYTLSEKFNYTISRTVQAFFCSLFENVSMSYTISIYHVERNECEMKIIARVFAFFNRYSDKTTTRLKTSFKKGKTDLICSQQGNRFDFIYLFI